MPADPQRIQSLFLAAIEVAAPADRAALLARECGDDAELRQRVEVLLQAHDRSGSFLDKPAVEPVTADAPEGQWIDRDAPPALAERPGTRVGRYKLLQQIGEGGMGVVYMAEQQEPVRRMVALKIIKPGMDSDAVVARFEAERQALALMDHQNIARVFDGGTTESGRPFFVMELVKGIPITRFCDENRLSPRERLALFVSVCEAVQHAHQKGVIHRDLKPSNVLVTLYDGKPVPKVIDFGVAKALHQRLTERTMFTAFGAVVGTLEYMSPEQAEMNALDVDTRSDVYSLGVLLYELLTGTTPLERERLRKAAYTEMLRLIREEEPLRPSMRISGSGQALARISAQRKTEPAQLARLVRGELDWIVMKALEKDRGRRYETATGLARDVERYLKDEPVEACPPSVGYRLGKFARKNSAVLSTAAAFMALILIASGVSIWLAMASTRAKQEADDKRKEADENAARADFNAGMAAGLNKRNEELLAEAKANAAETGRALDRMNVAKGVQLAEEGKVFAALPQFIKPLERGGLSPEEEKMHRTRIACYLRYTAGRPRLRYIFFCAKPFGVKVVGYPSRVVFSADGKRLLTATEDVVQLWDLQRGSLLATFKHLDGAQKAQFSPDGRRVLIASGRATVWIWDAASGRLIDAPVIDWGGLLQRPMALLPTSPWQFLVSAGAKGWENYGFMIDPDEIAYYTEISRDGRRALFSFTKRVRLLDLETRKLIGQRPDNSAEGPLILDGRSFEIDGNLVRLHAAVAGKTTSQTINHGSAVQYVTFSSDGSRILTVGKDHSARVYDSGTRELLAKIRLQGSPGADRSKWELSPDNRQIAGWEHFMGLGFLALWDVESGRLIREVPNEDADFSNFHWRPDGQQFLRASYASTGEVALWDSSSDWKRGLTLPQFVVEEAVYAPDGRTLATAGRDGVVRIWDLCDREESFAWQEPAKDAFSTDIRLRDHVTRSQCHLCFSKTFEAKSLVGAKKFAWLDPSHFLPPGTSFHVGTMSPDQSRVITCHPGSHYPNNSRILKLWDTKTREAVGKPLVQTAGEPEWLGWRYCYSCVAFSPDSRLLAAASDDWGASPPDRGHGKVQLYKTETGESIGKLLRHDGWVFFAVFSPDGERLVTCSADGTARVWRTKTGEPTGEIFRHGDYVTRAAFTPDGKIVATASLDGTVRLWKVGSGKPAGVLELKNHVPFDLAFHPDDSLLLVSISHQKQNEGKSGTHQIKLFEVATLQEISPTVRGLENEGDRPHFRLCKDGRITLGFFDKRTWDLTPDNRPVSELTKLGQLYSGQRLNERGGAAPLSKQELQALWSELSSKYPEEFAVSPKAAVEWRIEQIPSNPTFHRRWLAAELAEAGWQPGERGNEDMEPNNYLQRLLALAPHGRHAEATAAANALAARWAKDAGILYDCACVLALAAGAVKDDATLTERYAARAVVLLRQAIAAGFEDGQHMLKDPDLEALRQRDDFQMLLKKLNAKQP